MIRPWQEADGAQLAPMVLDALQANYDAGADMVPTKKNAAVLLSLGMIRAAEGDPCLVWEKGGQLIAYTLWVDLDNPMGLDYRGHVCYGLGTYVLPAWRRAGISDQLRDAAEALARERGFDKVVGVAYHEAGLRSCFGRGFTSVGTHVEKVLR